MNWFNTVIINPVVCKWAWGALGLLLLQHDSVLLQPYPKSHWHVLTNAFIFTLALMELNKYSSFGGEEIQTESGDSNNPFRNYLPYHGFSHKVALFFVWISKFIHCHFWIQVSFSVNNMVLSLSSLALYWLQNPIPTFQGITWPCALVKYWFCYSLWAFQLSTSQDSGLPTCLKVTVHTLTSPRSEHLSC